MKNKIEITEYSPLINILRVRYNDYMIHIDVSESTLKFEVYPVINYTNLSTGDKGIEYFDKEYGLMESHKEFNKYTCLKKLEGSYCWRGVWEGRLYFTDDEYWGEELSEFSDLYDNCIIPFCQKFIKELNPNRNYE